MIHMIKQQTSKSTSQRLNNTSQKKLTLHIEFFFFLGCTIYNKKRKQNTMAQTTMQSLPIYALANRNTVAGNNIFWQVSYCQEIPTRRQIEQAWLHCPKCTLPYPCQHVDAKQHALNTIERWKTYPANEGNPLCVEFESSGFCTSFAKRGYCRFHHETELKIQELPIPFARCKICTASIKTRCYIHDPPLGKSLCKLDKKLVKDGSEVDRRFFVGEIVGVASASAGGYVYAIVVQASKQQRMYTICTHLAESGRFSKNTGQKSLGELHKSTYQNWRRQRSVMKLLNITEASLKKEAEEANTKEPEWSFDFVVAEVGKVESEEDEED